MMYDLSKKSEEGAGNRLYGSGCRGYLKVMALIQAF